MDRLGAAEIGRSGADTAAVRGSVCIVYGSALMLSSNASPQLYALRQPRGEPLSGRMVSGAAGVQMLTGLVAIVLGTGGHRTGGAAHGPARWA